MAHWNAGPSSSSQNAGAVAHSDAGEPLAKNSNASAHPEASPRGVQAHPLAAVIDLQKAV
jgi:hypothetical protein